MEAYARIIPDQSLDRPLDYEIPEPLQGKIHIGSRVRIPIRQRLLLGTVVALLTETSVTGLKPIAEVVDDAPSISEKLLELARWIADYYCCPVEAAIRTVLPQVIRKAEMGHQRRKWLRLAPGFQESTLLEVQKKAPRQADALLMLQKNPEGLYLSDLLRKTGVSSSAITSLEKRGCIIESESVKTRDPFAGQTFIQSSPPPLNDEQKAALEHVCHAMESADAAKPMLLHGVTGSGKTEIYLHAIAEALKAGKTALVLVPEISLTPQTVDRFKSRFAEIQRQIAVLHSHLSDGERHDEWHRIRSGEAKIVIGARSAIFAPLENLGLIVVDEEHESSYKQEEIPRYHARDVAVVRAMREKCPILLGTATPSLESYRNVTIGKYDILRLTERIDSREMPVIRVLDMRQLNRKKNDSIISFPLATAIEGRINRHEQTILFLNRRGFSSSMICNKCGYVAECPHCSVTLTYHRADARLVCHICGHLASVPSACPSCQDPSIRYQGVGTQRVEESVRRMFPKACVERMDADSMSRKHSYTEVLGRFRRGEIDILIGTQMIAKGLDFPNVTLVGIINADLSLHLPDFRAGERTFQLLTQVAGRAGRGGILGEVFVQTFTPQSPSIQFARHHDFEGFFEQELAFRQQFQFPPITHMTLITVRSISREKAEFSADTLTRRLAEAFPKDKVIIGGPSPAPLEKAKSYYRYHVTLRSGAITNIGRTVNKVLAKLSFPDDVTAAVDVDPQYLL